MDFGSNSTYVCAGDDLYFEWDRDLEDFNITCLEDGSWDAPDIWPICVNCKDNPFMVKLNVHLLFLAVNCTESPERPGAGTWEWSGDLSYQTEIEYTCGPYGSFLKADGEVEEILISTCEWNKTWTPSELSACVCEYYWEL